MVVLLGMVFLLTRVFCFGWDHGVETVLRLLIRIHDGTLERSTTLEATNPSLRIPAVVVMHSQDGTSMSVSATR
ncbi:hypothetical protein F4823DRAFT_570206 [Ustulina deusta]|nr:hypothetical protein F4823DRAFT_570206 [Ustulina deusta]